MYDYILLYMTIFDFVSNLNNEISLDKRNQDQIGLRLALLSPIFFFQIMMNILVLMTK